MLNKETIEKSLNLLGQILELEKAPHIEIVVCGGSSLIATGLIKNKIFTRDIDIVGTAYRDKNNKFIIEECKQLPEPLKKATSRVARDLGLNENWINTAPTDLVKQGLPEGFSDRLHTREYGKALTVHFISRVDQIYFKTYAAVDSGPGRHVDDLLALKPTEEEMEKAAKWTLTQDNSEDFYQILKDMLRKIGYGSVAERI